MSREEGSPAQWTRTAEDDLREIFRYIAFQEHRTHTARKVVQSIREHCDHYAKLTAGGKRIGTDRSDLRPGVRSFTHQRWVVLFRPVEESIRVLAVFDGSRDYAKLFDLRADESGSPPSR